MSRRDEARVRADQPAASYAVGGARGGSSEPPCVDGIHGSAYTAPPSPLMMRLFGAHGVAIYPPLSLAAEPIRGKNSSRCPEPAMDEMKLETILIANRGEIACRIVRTAR